MSVGVIPDDPGVVACPPLEPNVQADLLAQELQELLPMGHQLEEEDLSLDMHKREIGMTQTKGEANLTPALWDENRTGPARNGMMRAQDQATQ